jgi:hypothetical protein
MESYDEIVGWAETMLETVENGRMPPWHADPAHGSFLNSRRMPEEDKQILRDWVLGGMPQGDESLLPDPPAYVDGWQLPRTPDVVVDMRAEPFVVPKDGVVEYQYFVADPHFQKDTWVTAAEVIPGSRAVVHHAIVFVRPPDGDEFHGVGWLGGYVPGQRVFPLPSGYGRLVPAGSKFVFQMHYTPNGSEETDISKVGLLIADDSQITHQVFTTMAINQEFEIPPQVSSHEVVAKTRRLPKPAELLAITPHMHFRGKSFQLFTSSQPQDPLLKVPNYDFNWQHTYLLDPPLPLKGIDHLKFISTFDNSSANPFNPNPSEKVTWGDQTWEEMAVAFFEIAQPRTSLDTSDTESKKTMSASDREAAVEGYVARAMQELDRNGDGIIRKSETEIVVRHGNFASWDLNDDGLATKEEIRSRALEIYQ